MTTAARSSHSRQQPFVPSQHISRIIPANFVHHVVVGHLAQRLNLGRISLSRFQDGLT